MSEKNPSKRKKRKWLRRLIGWLLVLALLAGGGFIAYSKLKNDYTVTYNGFTATRGTLSNSLSFSGSLSLVDSKAYAAPSAATVRAVYVAVGDQVKEGDRLLRLSDGTSFTADFAGRVNRLSAAKGDEVAGGEELVQIADFDHLKVALRVDEYDISNVTVGEKCDISVTATGAKLTSVIDTIDYISSSQGSVAYYTATAYVDVTGMENTLPGMQVTATLVKEQVENAVILKMDALSFDRTNSAFVYVEGEGGAMTQRPVEVGLSNGNYVEIRSGVSEGETVYAVAKKEETKGLFETMFTTQQVNRPMNNNRNTNRNTNNGGFPGGAR